MRSAMLAVLVLSTPLACAQEPESVYLGLALGQAHFKDPCGLAPPRVVCDGDSRARKFFMGYQATRYFAVEFALSDLGTVSSHDTAFPNSTETAALTATELSALASWPLGKRLAIFGRLGLYSGDVQADTPAFPAAAPPPQPQFSGWQNGSTNGIAYGLGVRYTVLDNVALRAEWQKMPAFGGTTRNLFDVDSVTLGVLVYFVTAPGSP